MNLSEKELKFLLRFEKYVKRIYINYFCGGLSTGIALGGLAIGIKYGTKDAFLMAIFFGGIGSIIFIQSWVYQRLFRIIVKMKNEVTELS